MTTHQERLDQATVVMKQIKETVTQDALGVTVRVATVTCPCGTKRAIVKAYQCLYCKVWFCTLCAEEHFGQTVNEYREKGEL